MLNLVFLSTKKVKKASINEAPIRIRDKYKSILFSSFSVLHPVNIEMMTSANNNFFIIEWVWLV